MSPKDWFPELHELKKTLNKQYKHQSLAKFKFFTDGSAGLPGILDWFSNAVFVSLDAEWWNMHRDPAPSTELGFAVLYAQGVMDFVAIPNAKLEDLFAKIQATHLRITETSHMINHGDWLNDNAQDNFLFGQTGFVDVETAKNVLRTFTTEKTWQTPDGSKHRPIILIGQNLYQDLKHFKNKHT